MVSFLLDISTISSYVELLISCMQNKKLFVPPDTNYLLLNIAMLNQTPDPSTLSLHQFGLVVLVSYLLKW